jgi:hypothetical protein
MSSNYTPFCHYITGIKVHCNILAFHIPAAYTLKFLSYHVVYEVNNISCDSFVALQQNRVFYHVTEDSVTNYEG